MPKLQRAHQLGTLDTLFFLKNVTHTRSLFIYMLATQALIIAAFTQKTIKNTHDYFVNNREEIEWEQNQAGFVRARLPSSLIDLNDSSLNLNDLTNVSLRCNFWIDMRGNNSIQLEDLTVHDHPNGFMSYIGNNGYSHEIYEVLSHNNVSTACDLQRNASSNCAVHYRYNKYQDQIVKLGTVQLKLAGIDSVQSGDTVIYDNVSVHRIREYQPNTLTLNIVRQDGDGEFNIFIPSISSREATKSSSRPRIKGEQSFHITDKVIDLYENLLRKFNNTLLNQPHRILNYSVLMSAPPAYSQTNQFNSLSKSKLSLFTKPSTLSSDIEEASLRILNK